MQNFEFRNPTKIVFGRGTENQVGAEAAAYSKRILLHFGGGSVARFGPARPREGLAAARPGSSGSNSAGSSRTHASVSSTKACGCASRRSSASSSRSAAAA